MSGPLLALDTAGARCSAALLDPSTGQLMASAEPEIGRGHAEALMDVIAGVLDQAGASYGDLSRIAVTVGPGSFTGIRVGVSAARGLALALGIPALGVSTLEALAEPHLHQGAPVLAVQDAKRGEVYAALYREDGSVIRDARALAPEDLAAFKGGETLPLLAGSGAAIALERLPEARIVSQSPLVAIASVARLGAMKAPGDAVRPLYLRSADAKPQTAHALRASAPFHSAAVVP